MTFDPSDSRAKAADGVAPAVGSTNRYVRQERFSQIGQEGQQRLRDSQVLVVGCGALGSMIAERLTRSGVGAIRLVDRDWVELTNLQRQTLFTEEHARTATPKAVAAAEMLARINSSVRVEPIVDDLTCDNIPRLAKHCELILDGTDNFETRFLINDYCVRFGVPWIHGGCLGASGQVMSIIPGQTACFRCLVPELPPADTLQTCDSAGVLGPAVGLIACWQAAEALKVLSGNLAAVCKQLIVLDSWDTDCRCVHLSRAPDCATCQQRYFPFLDGQLRTDAAVLCGKNAVQLQRPDASNSMQDLAGLAQRLSPLGPVQSNAFFVRLQLAEFQITIFRGGRTIVEGTTSPAEAKTVLARTLGS
ncbi:MAG: ThiF family adenylyltransferase [Pirellulaceae bacterium]|nr:ThiF family adenylyltransferase [Pirellulaceae bacterium]